MKNVDFWGRYAACVRKAGVPEDQAQQRPLHLRPSTVPCSRRCKMPSASNTTPRAPRKPASAGPAGSSHSMPSATPPGSAPGLCASSSTARPRRRLWPQAPKIKLNAIPRGASRVLRMPAAGQRPPLQARDLASSVVAISARPHLPRPPAVSPRPRRLSRTGTPQPRRVY